MAASSSRHTETIVETPRQNAYSYHSPQDIEEGDNRNPYDSMDRELYYLATQSQDKDKGVLLDLLCSGAALSVSHQGNSVIHLLASRGQSELLSKIHKILGERLVELSLQQNGDNIEQLYWLQNSDGDLPLHLAASTGDLETVISIVEGMNAEVMILEGIFGHSKCDFSKKNNRGNTALHVALENNHQKVAEYLVGLQYDCPIGLSTDKYNKTPLCMAAEAGNVTLFETMIRGMPTSDSWQTGVSSSILRGAIIGRNTGMLKTILRETDAGKDEEWLTPLTLAVYINNFDAVCCLLDKSTRGAYQMDGNGFLPIHVASRKGYIKIVEELLNRCPDLRELLDRKGQNILHVAAGQGRAEMVKYITKKPELEVLFNGRENIGDTPLHVAVRNWHPRIVRIMTRCRRVNLHLLNNAGMTALDIAEDVSEVDKEMLFRRKLTYMALKLANAPRSGETLAAKAKPVLEDFYSNTKGKYDDLLLSRKNINTLLLVSTLVATITFAAGFTMPGGYNSSGNDEGMATLDTKWPFQVFVICNTMAMYSSVTVAIALIWAQTGDRIIVYVAMRFVLPMLGVALIMMSTAFLAGVAVVTSNLIWLWCINTIIGSSFLIFIILLFAPLTVRLSSEKFITRCILQASFSLLLMVTRYDSDDDVGGDVEVGVGNIDV